MSRVLSSDKAIIPVFGGRISLSLRIVLLMYGPSSTFQTSPRSSTNKFQTLISEGYNIFRVAFSMERLAPSGITGALGPAYLANLTATVNHITSKGAYAVLDPHNFGRFNGAIITDVNAFKTFWTNLATAFKGNAKVVS